MRIFLESETRIRLDLSGEGFEITSETLPVSPYHLLAASLASCTALTVSSWATGAGIPTEGLAITVSWSVVAGHPKRVEWMEQVIHWPALPDERRASADRAAALCPIHATLNAGTTATTRVQRD